MDYLNAPGDALYKDERKAIREASELAVERFGPQIRIVNIGVGRGGTLHCLRAGAPGALLLGVDIDFEMRKLVGDPGAHLLQGDSNVVHLWVGPPIHVLLIDGDHHYLTVKDDLQWAKKVPVGGLVLFHDFAPCERDKALFPHIRGVRQAVLEWLDGEGKAFRSLRRVRSVLIVERVEA